MTDVYGLMSSGQYEQALGVLEKVPPEARDAHYYREGGRMYLLLQRYDLAQRSFELLQPVAPTAKNTNDIEYVVLTCWLSGRQQQAISMLENLVKALDEEKMDYASDPQGLGTRYMLVALLTLDGRHADALAAIDRLSYNLKYPQHWPGSLVLFLQRRLGVDRLLAEARRFENPSAVNRQLCVIEFYSGILATLHGKSDEAQSMFRKAAQRHVIIEREWYLAADLARKAAGVD